METARVQISFACLSAAIVDPAFGQASVEPWIVEGPERPLGEVRPGRIDIALQDVLVPNTLFIERVDELPAECTDLGEMAFSGERLFLEETGDGARPLGVQIPKGTYRVGLWANGSTDEPVYRLSLLSTS